MGFRFAARHRGGMNIGSSFTGGGGIAPSFLVALCTSFLISPITPPPTSSSRCAARFNSGLDGQPREGNIKQKGSEFSPSLLPFTWFGNTLSCMLFRATRRAGKAGYEPATWPEDLGPYMPNPRKALTIRGCQVAPDVRKRADA